MTQVQNKSVLFLHTNVRKLQVENIENHLIKHIS